MIIYEKISRLFTLEGAVKKGGRNLKLSDLSEIQDAALAVDKDKVQWVGARKDLPAKFKKAKKVSLKGQIVLPGFIDSHTHLVFAGDRAGDFEKRLSGVTYQEIAASGGGILRTVNATREATAKELLDLAQKRLKSFASQGFTTIEAKSGYGLSFESEKKILEVTKKLKASSPLTVKSTYLAAHDVPPEFKGKKSEYMELVAGDWLKKLAKLCDYADIFVDEGFF
jgi:imidazolonepropionase